MPTLLSFLGPEHSWATQTSAGDFMKAIITVSANASQNEQTCIGPNELTRQLVSVPCVEQLISYMLGGGNALTVGVGIVIEVIRKNNSDYDPDVGAEANAVPSSRDPIYLGTLLRLFAEHVPDFVNLIMNVPAKKDRIESTFGDKIEPLGFDRFKTCELMAELLHCSNMGLLNEVGSEELIAVRDAERKRLRAEGKLSAMRGEEMPSSADDLTMRISHSSPVDAGRKLEVTNISEDDGFEEVAHSTEMTEDTSHEFVKAEEEIQSGQSASFLEKDGDDFVDEPLSSPRLSLGDNQPKEQQFDEPDFVVAPLSPSKEKAGEIQDLPPSPSKDEEKPKDDEKLEDLVDDMQKAMLEDKGASPEPDATATPDESEASITPALDTPASSSAAETEAIPQVGPSEPDPSAEPVETQPKEGVERPAPLFAQSSAPVGDAPPTEEPKETSEPEIPAEEPAADQTPAEATEADESKPDGGDVLMSEVPEGTSEIPEMSNLQPVVGDFLKMQFVEYNVVPTILSFFFKYPWNNFLHNVVYDIVQQVFNGPMDRGFNPTLAISLFEAADVTTQIINGQQASEESQRKSKTRMGYMGHLTLIAEEVVKFTERHPPELLSETVLLRVMDQEWINYVEGALAETRERDNAILGGVRPEIALSNRQAGGLAGVGLSSLGAAFGSSQGGSNALAEAGLNGGLGETTAGDGGNGIGPFAISAGTLMSGFGSSSDEDEDEEVENEEDVNNEVSFSFDRRTRRFSGLSLAGRPAPHTIIRSVSLEVGALSEDEDGGDEDSDEGDYDEGEPVKRFGPSRHNVRTPDSYDSDDGSDNGEEISTRPLQVERIRSGPTVSRGTSGPSEDQLFEEVSLEDGDSDASGISGGRASPDGWEDDFEEGVDEDGNPVQQVEDREKQTTVVSPAEGDSLATRSRGDPVKPSSPPKPAVDPLQRPRAMPKDTWEHAIPGIEKKEPNEILDDMLDVLRGPLIETKNN